MKGLLIFVPSLIWMGMLMLPPPQWAREGNLALCYPFLLALAWFAVVAVLLAL